MKARTRCYDSGPDDPDDFSEAALGAFMVDGGEQWSGWVLTDDANHAEANFTRVQPHQPELMARAIAAGRS